jgi:RimJ/RimL family protein N-acetyltransferase
MSPGGYIGVTTRQTSVPPSSANWNWWEQNAARNVDAFSARYALLERLYCRSIFQNTASVSFHDTFGARRATLLEGYFSVRGERQTAIEHSVAASDWPILRARHYSTISRLASATLR